MQIIYYANKVSCQTVSSVNSDDSLTVLLLIHVIALITCATYLTQLQHRMFDNHAFDWA